jgi:hypothetical protein
MVADTFCLIVLLALISKMKMPSNWKLTLDNTEGAINKWTFQKTLGTQGTRRNSKKNKKTPLYVNKHKI